MSVNDEIQCWTHQTVTVLFSQNIGCVFSYSHTAELCCINKMYRCCRCRFQLVDIHVSIKST